MVADTDMADPPSPIHCINEKTKGFELSMRNDVVDYCLSGSKFGALGVVVDLQPDECWVAIARCRKPRVVTMRQVIAWHVYRQ